MSACPKLDFEYDTASAAGSDDRSEADRSLASARSTSRALTGWHRAIHVLALLGFLGFCAVMGLLWFALATEAG